MEPIIFIKGFTVGFFLCAPVGPIGLLCARRTLTHGRIAGVVSVLGASTVDAFYCAVAGLGVAWISSFLKEEQTWIQFFGAFILIVLAIRVIMDEPRHKTPPMQMKGLFGSFSSAFLLTLVNPMPIVVFTAALAAFGVHGWKGNYTSTAALVSGVFFGSALWSAILAGVVGRFRAKFNSKQLRIMNTVSGAIILVFGVVLGFAALSR
jgi:threonine/homoserine/homoserine lactone efflux protein